MTHNRTALFVVALLLGAGLAAVPAAQAGNDEGCTDGVFTEAGNVWATANTLQTAECTAGLGQGEDWFKVDADSLGVEAPLEAEACPDGFDLQLDVYSVSGGEPLPDIPRIPHVGDGPVANNVNRLLLPFRSAEEDEAEEDGCEQALVEKPLLEGTWYLRIDADTDALDTHLYDIEVG